MSTGSSGITTGPMTALTFANARAKAESQSMLIYGGYKHGKTVLGATASAYFPVVFPSPEPVYLKDTLFIQFDQNGLESLTNGNVIPYVHSLVGVDGNYENLVKGLADTTKLIESAVKDGIRFVIVDTLNSLQIMLDHHVRKVKTGFDVLNTCQGHHVDFNRRLRHIPAMFIYIAHAKSTHPVLGEDADAETRRKAASMPGVFDYTVDLPAPIAKYYKGNTSNIFALVTKSAKGKPEERVLITKTVGGYEAGTRWHGLQQEEPAHLGQLFAKANVKF